MVSRLVGCRVYHSRTDLTRTISSLPVGLAGSGGSGTVGAAGEGGARGATAPPAATNARALFPDGRSPRPVLSQELLRIAKAEHPELPPEVVFVLSTTDSETRDCGLACHVGVSAQLPTVGVNPSWSPSDPGPLPNPLTTKSRVQASARNSGREMGVRVRATVAAGCRCASEKSRRSMCSSQIEHFLGSAPRATRSPNPPPPLSNERLVQRT